MTAFCQHISFFPFSSEEKASRSKHATMHELSKSDLKSVCIIMLGLEFSFYFILYFPSAMREKTDHHSFSVCQNRQMTVLLVSDCCQITHCGSSTPDHCHTMLCAPLPQLLESLGIYDKEWTGGELTLSHPWNLSPALLTCFQWWKNLFWILRSSEQQYGMSSVS